MDKKDIDDLLGERDYSEDCVCPECGKMSQHSFWDALKSVFKEWDHEYFSYTCPDGHTWQIKNRHRDQLLTYKAIYKGAKAAKGLGLDL